MPDKDYEEKDTEINDSAETEDSEEDLQDETDEAEEKPKHHFHMPHLTKKFWIWLIVIALALTAGWWFFFRTKKSDTSSTETAYVRTVTLTKGSLENTVTADGTIASQDTSNVTTSLKYVVKSVDVSVGDTVAAGDTIVTLDTTELEKQIARKETQDQESYEKLQTALENATYTKNDAYTTMTDAKTALSTAQTTYDSANAAYTKAQNEVSTFQSNYDDLAAKLVTATSTENTALAAKQAAASACSAAGYGETCGSAPTGDALKTAYDTAAAAESTASANYSSAKTAADNAQTELKNKQSSVDYTSAEQAYTSAKATLDKAQSTYDDAAQKFNTVNAAYFDAEDALAKGVTDTELEDLKTDLSDCTLKAETAGTVTALNATVGSTVTDSTVATIQDTSSLQITVSVDEYDIQSIQKGMTATITSDAITDELTGTVSTVSPVATTSNQGQSSSSFNVTVTINDSTDALLIGMSAEVKIILSSTSDVYTVPIDAVGKDDSGNDVIYVQGDDGTYSPVVVTTGDSNDYYIEVSGTDLTEGMVVRASADANAAAVSSAEATASSSSGLDLGGMSGSDSAGGSSQGGGDAPSGGGGGQAPSGGGPGGN